MGGPVRLGESASGALTPGDVISRDSGRSGSGEVGGVVGVSASGVVDAGVDVGSLAPPVAGGDLSSTGETVGCVERSLPRWFDGLGDAAGVVTGRARADEPADPESGDVDLGRVG